MPAGYKTENSGAFLLSIIKHSDLKVVIRVDYEAVGKEHGITAHSAYCRLRGIKAALSGLDKDALPSTPTKRKRSDVATPRKRKVSSKTSSTESMESKVSSKEEDAQDRSVQVTKGSPAKNVKQELLLMAVDEESGDYSD